MKSRRLMPVIPMLLLFLAVIGCSTETDTEGEESKSDITLAVATSDMNVGYPYATLPLAMGWYEEEGLDVDVVPGESSFATIQLVESGEADLGIIVADTAIMSQVNEDVPIKNVYPMSRKNSYSFAVKDDSDIDDISDLEGETIGHGDLGAATVPYAETRYKEADIDLESIENLAVGYGSQAFESVENESVAAFVIPTSFYVNAIESGYDFRQLPSAEWQEDLYGMSLYATDEFIEERGGDIEKVGRAFAKATVFSKNNSEAAVEIFHDQYPERADDFQTDVAILEGQLYDMKADEYPDDFEWGSQETENWDFFQEYLYDADLIDTQVDSTELYDDRFEDEFTNFDVEEIVREAEEWE